MNSIAKTSKTEMSRNTGRDIAMDYLRSFLTVLLVCFHSGAAYSTFNLPVKFTFINPWKAITDANSWPAVDIFMLLTDSFFMPLFFLIAGIFTFSSLHRSGTLSFLSKRIQRLGIPFLIATFTIIPLAYWASHISIATEPLPTFRLYYREFFSTGKWTPGPLWFLWVLLACTGLGVAIHRLVPAGVEKLSRLPLSIFLFLSVVVFYIPLYTIVGPYHWSMIIGPFFIQTSRIGLYFVFFFTGTLIGLKGEQEPDLFPGSYVKWLVAGFAACLALLVLIIKDAFSSRLLENLTEGTATALTCFCICLGLLGLFRNNVKKRFPLLDNFSANSYCIFLVHYPFVIWIQYGLLSMPVPAWLKFIITAIAALLLSWGASILLRKIPQVRRII